MGYSSSFSKIRLNVHMYLGRILGSWAISVIDQRPALLLSAPILGVQFWWLC